MSNTPRQPLPTRVTITMARSTFMDLRDRADREGRSTSNLCAFLLEQAMEQAIKKPAQSRQEGRW